MAELSRLLTDGLQLLKERRHAELDVGCGLLERIGGAVVLDLVLVIVRKRPLGRGRQPSVTRIRTLGGLAGTTLTCAFAVTSHGTLPASSARLAVRRVAATPAAVLAQLQSLRVVPLALIGLVIAALALFARESGSDPNVSTSHGGSFFSKWSGSGVRTAGAKTNAARRRSSV